MDIALQMTVILGTCLVGLLTLVTIQIPHSHSNNKNDTTNTTTASSNTTTTATTTTSSCIQSRFFPDLRTEPSKRAYEIFVAAYTPIWIGIFIVIVAFQLYEQFTPRMYIYVCGGLALPFVLQPVLLPQGPDQHRSLFQRYSCKANVWLAIYSFIGNYFYTHYFYSVLQAAYTMPHAIRFNNVPVAMYCATHFYFSTYHLFSNLLLRKICTTYQRTWQRHVLLISFVCVFAYFTAFLETLTISAYPYWTFAHRDQAYVVGSAFYGIYFLISFPVFFQFDHHIDQPMQTTTATGSRHPSVSGISVWDTILSSCGTGMLILILLDLVRLYLDIPLVMGNGGGSV